jgi:dUTPase
MLIDAELEMEEWLGTKNIPSQLNFANTYPCAICGHSHRLHLSYTGTKCQDCSCSCMKYEGPMKLNIVSGRMSRETKHSAAFDLFYDNGELDESGMRKPFIITDTPVAIPTGLFTVFEPGYVAIIKEKSGLALKGVELHGGVIDADYRQEWKVIARFPPHCEVAEASGYKISHDPAKRRFTVQPGEKIAQVIFVKLVDVECDSPGFITKDDIRQGGLGSTGNK